VLARQIAGRAKEHPNEFGALARRHSDDPSTAARNGSLGTLRASELLAWPALLDAIEVLPVGHVSEPIDTSAGVVILQRNPIPIQQTVSGAHIVVNHQDVPWLRALGAQVPRRTYEQAWRRALEIHRELAAHPERFGDVAAQQSDHPDKSRGGDIGNWSTLEPTHMPRVLEEVRLLGVGEISEPFETAFGIEIVQRTEHRPRAAYAMQAIRFRYAPNADGALEAAWAKAESTLSELHGAPQAFDATLSELCCKDVVAKVEGRDDDALVSLLRNLPVGAIADRPVAANAEVLLVKRLGLWDAPPPRPVTLGLAGLTKPAPPSVIDPIRTPAVR